MLIIDKQTSRGSTASLWAVLEINQNPHRGFVRLYGFRDNNHLSGFLAKTISEPEDIISIELPIDPEASPLLREDHLTALQTLIEAGASISALNQRAVENYLMTTEPFDATWGDAVQS